MPDYRADAVQVEYYANGGQPVSGWFEDTEGLVYRCHDHHVPGETDVHLLSLTDGKRYVQRSGATLIGWSTAPHEALVTSAGEAAATVVASVNIPAKLGDAPVDNMKVYAVWAEDINCNGTADDLEMRYTLHYEANGSENAPADVPGCLAGTSVALAKDGPARDKALFLGWSLRQRGVYSSGAPGGTVLLGESYTFPSSQPAVDGEKINIYAVWAADANNNGTPDYDEPRYTLTYNANGGQPTPSAVNGILPGIVVSIAEGPAREKAAFLGWSQSYVSPQPFTSEPAVAMLHPGETPTVNSDLTLYAVWAADGNANGLADYADPIEIRYEGNAVAGGSVTGVPAAQTVNYVQKKLTLSSEVPVYTAARSAGVTFAGWSETRTDHIYGRNETALRDIVRLAPGAEYTLPADASGAVTLYAVWAEDTNGSGVADALEPRYTLTYHRNGGTATPSRETDLLAGDEVSLNTTAAHDPTADGTPVLLIGWTTRNDIFRRVITWESGHSEQASIRSKLAASPYAMPAENVDLYAAWAADENKNGTADYLEEKHSLNYITNGPAAPDGLNVSQIWLPGMTVALWQPGSTPWRSAGAVFLGWTPTNVYATEYHQTPLTAAPDASVLVSEVKVGDADVTVYVLWAADLNGNGVPDYGEARVTISFDSNGGRDPATGAAGSLEPITGLLPGTSRPLPGRTAIKWQKDWNGGDFPAVFAGWSPVRMNGIVDQDGIYRGYSVNDILVRDPYPVPSRSVTLYAVYAADEDNDGVPDYLANAVHVEYYANGGEAADSHITVEADGHFYTCGHHHVPAQPDVDLLTAEETGHMIRREGHIFLGWSLKAGLSPCRSAADVGAAGLVSAVTMPASGNAKVYAVWAADENGNGTADYLDPRYHHSYYLNTQLSTWLDDTTKPFEQNTPPLDGALPEGVACVVIDGHEIRGESDAAKAAAELLPAPEADILAGSFRRLADNDLLGERTDYDADGNELHHYVHIGWTGHCHKAAENDAETAAWRLVSDAPNMPDVDGGVLRKFTVGEQWAFALWALDDNHNGQADYLDRHFTLTYDANGSDPSTAPGPVSGILSLTEVTLAQGPAKTGAAFLGWSADSRVKGKLYAAEPDVTLLPAGGKLQITEDVTLYAVWAKDANGNGAPDHTEPAASAASGSAAHAPYTGDGSHAALWAALMVLCSGALACILRRRRRCRG